jgi:uncharacterized membrane protein
MWTRQELKEKGKAAFKANYWRNVLVAFLLGLLTTGTVISGRFGGSDSDSPDVQLAFSSLTPTQIGIIAGGTVLIIIISVILDILVFNPLQIGCYAFFKDNVKTHNTEVNMIKVGFTDYGHKFCTMLLYSVFLALWTMLFIIPGIIKSYSYRMVPFIVQDYPDLTAKEVINKSREMMDGQKMETFKLDLSFIGWFLLALITLGLAGIFWTNPYFYNTNAALYRRLNGEDAADASAPAVEEVTAVPAEAE